MVPVSRRGVGIRQGRRFRTAALAVVLAGLLWLTTAVTVSGVFGQRNSAVALAWWPGHAAARGTLARQLLMDKSAPSAAQRSRARELAEAALARDSLSVPAVTTLGLLAAEAKDLERANRLFRYSETLSRRDLATQIWLIERDVTKNDISGALTHYDRALRTSSTAGDLLFPILARASIHPKVAEQVSRLLGSRPPWWQPFVRRVTFDAALPAGSIPHLLAALRLDPQLEEERTILADAIRRLEKEGQYASAFHLYRSTDSVRAPGVNIRNSGFEADNPLPPFDWLLVQDPDLRATIDRRGDRGSALFLLASNGRGGEVARQLLMLAPGTYSLSAVAGDVSGEEVDRPNIGIVCASKDRLRIADLRVPSLPPTGGRVAREFAVPPRCEAQYLIVSAHSGLDGESSLPWLDDFTIRRIS
jgi:hypothetical protein